MSTTSAGFEPKIAVLVPCHNEAASIGKVVADFGRALPGAEIHVCDNASTDRTAEIATAAGARVHFEPQPGKGNVVRRMFADVEADIYVLVDGDDTYDADSAPSMMHKLLSEHLDMVVGVREAESQAAYRAGHRLGNRVLTGLVTLIFGNRVSDMLSGFRVFSRRFVKSFPALAAGFETETELTVHALELRMPIAEVLTPYKSRAPDSASKLNTFRDGWRILQTIAQLVRQERPIGFFGLVAALLAVASLILVWPVAVTYFETGLVPRLPTALLSTGMMLLASLSLACGLVLDTVTRGRQEMKRLTYLSIPWRAD
jgi:glycosyltransferase involved in cell wall biosynthesis